MTPPPYTSLEALLHDPFWAAEGPPVELDFLAAVLRDHPGPSLEVGCGSGRLLLPLLQKGHDVEGLDLSADMLALCRESAAALALAPVLHLGDMTAFDPGKTYASLLLPAFTLQMAPDPAAALAHFHRLLAPAGWLYLSVFRPLAELNRELPENEWYPDHETTLPDGRHASIATRHRLDRKNRILVREHHYRLTGPGPESAVEHLSEQVLRWFTPRQLHGLLVKAGFTPLTGFADFDPELPVDDDAQIVTVIASRS